MNLLWELKMEKNCNLIQDGFQYVSIMEPSVKCFSYASWDSVEKFFITIVEIWINCYYTMLQWVIGLFDALQQEKKTIFFFRQQSCHLIAVKIRCSK